MKVFLWMGIISTLLAATVRAELPAAQVEAAREKWGEEIAKLKALDKVEKHPEGAILFLGSSSVRMWKTIKEDMAPYHVIQRGYGGAKYSDLAVFAEELIAPHKFRAVVIYVGNDVVGKDDDASPEQVAEWFKIVAAAALAKQPEADVFCVGITPTPKRWEAQSKIEMVNAALKVACYVHPKMNFIITSTSYINEAGLPRKELFLEDELHQNEAGYKIWAQRIKTNLELRGIK
jgi:lysophospholipase L1-like esterase